MKGATFENRGNEALRAFLKILLEQGVVSSVVVTHSTPKGDSYPYILTSDPAEVDTSSPIAPIITQQGARVVSKLTKKGEVRKATAVVLRPCEVRGVVELAKIKQVNLNNLLIIGYDCPGVYPLTTFTEGDHQDLQKEHEERYTSFGFNTPRPACQTCLHPVASSAHIQFGVLGAPEGKSLVITAYEKVAKALEEAGLAFDADLTQREESIAQVLEKRRAARDNLFAEFAPTVSGDENLMKTLAACINCRNCMRVCPICFCRECFFQSDAVKTESVNYLERAERKGGLRFLPDTLLFHLGRMNHMATSCLACGTCEDACPAMVPVGRMFTLASHKVQEVFDYTPGASLDDPLPYLEYQEEEFHQWEKPYEERLE
jgi:formate dehydrogenase subunit beta